MEQFPLEEVVARVGSRFAVVVAAAERAKQIKDGSPPLVETPSRNPLTIALTEIAEGKISVIPAEKRGEDGHVATLDEYFAGRDVSDTEGLPFTESQRAAQAAARTEPEDEFDFDESDFDDLDDEEDDEVDDEEDDDDDDF